MSSQITKTIVETIENKISCVQEAELKDLEYSHPETKQITYSAFRFGYAACLTKLFNEGLLTEEEVRKHGIKE